ncbi:MAG: hypothetical protein A3D95_04205 [Betaproteobacteria bacterium RIFCSPHIGHO2_12_FULL_69_13]|nr:MAG: hypothetical protein A3D95_04205 [Betaproteobacteria bacterium RIFCSPHIGHO2_12_FULL_69_13]
MTTQRRRFLRGSAALAAGAVLPLPAAAQTATVYELAGEVLVNGRRIGRDAAIRAGDTIFTGRGASIWFIVAGDSFFLRQGTELRLEAARARETLIGALRLLTGAIGGTFAKGAERRLVARTVSIGIRGTCVYVETAPEVTYACTCFGATELKTPQDEKMMESVVVVTGNHFARRVHRDPHMGMRIEQAPFERHTNEEMARLEALAGRPNPFRT